MNLDQLETQEMKNPSDCLILTSDGALNMLVNTQLPCCQEFNEMVDIKYKAPGTV